MHIRPALLADAPAVARLHLKSWRDAYRDLAPAEAYRVMDEAMRRARWTAILTDPPAHQLVLVAERDGRLLGMGAASAPSEAAFGDRGEIKSVYIDPDAKRTGLGRRLMALLAGQLTAWNYPGAALGVVAGNTPAIAFYQALGGRIAGRYADPGPIWQSENVVMVWDDLDILTAAANGLAQNPPAS